MMRTHQMWNAVAYGRQLLLPNVCAGLTADGKFLKMV